MPYNTMQFSRACFHFDRAHKFRVTAIDSETSLLFTTHCGVGLTILSLKFDLNFILKEENQSILTFGKALTTSYSLYA